MLRFIRLCAVALALQTAFASSAPTNADSPVASISTDEIRALREQLDAQQAQIEKLRATVEAQQRLLDRVLPAAPPATSVVVQAALAATVSAPDLARGPESAPKGFAGFQFSGDFRLRGDVQLRSSNDVAGPLQNVRGRYRLRLNVDKELDPRFKFHMQLSTGALNSPLTNEQDMAGMATKSPFSIAEAWIDFHPNKYLSFRVGRTEEVFADNMRFLWDDDIRFNGFQQIARIPFGSNALGFKSLELRAGEYILTNPAVYVLPSNSPYIAAGYKPGQKVRSSTLIHPGFVLDGDLGTQWGQSFSGGIELYRNPDQIQLASTANGYPVLTNGAVGVALSGVPGGAGNPTTTPGGAMYSAPNFQIAHFSYRVQRKGIRVGSREMPLWFDIQASRNVGTSKYRNAGMASVNFGAIKQAGDVRFLYQLAFKDANSMISQFTDDNLGTGSGVNIRVNAFRFDIGLTRFMQFQNLFFLQRQLRGNNANQQFFVPLQQGANQTLRYLGQLAISF